MSINVVSFSISLKFDGKDATFAVKVPGTMKDLSELPGEVAKCIDREIVAFAKQAAPEMGKLASELQQQKSHVEQLNAQLEKAHEQLNAKAKREAKQ
jgi:hypothetical protein